MRTIAKTASILPALLALSQLAATPVSAQATSCLNIAHRGGGRLAPESTLVAFHRAIEVGADVLEMDLHATSDGVIVVCHDPTVDRTTNGRGAIRERTFESLRELDAGHCYTPDGGRTFPYRGEQMRIPSFEEVLTSFPDTPLVLEIKQTEPPIVEPILGLLTRHHATGRAILASKHGEVLDDVRARDPGVRTSFSGTEVTGFLLLGGTADYRPPGNLLQIPARLVTQGLLDRATRLGLEVQAWTVNDAPAMEELVRLGVHGIMTDDPAMLERVLQGRRAH